MNEASSLASCAVRPTISARPRSVSVNGVVIPRDAIARETQNHPADKPIDAWQAAARALVIRELLLQEGRRLCIVPQPATDDEGRRETDDEAVIRAVIDIELATPEPTDHECRRYFDNNRRRFRSPALHEVAHILLTPATGMSEAELANAAGRLIAALHDDPSQFEALALRHSACPSRNVGGSLGQIGPGQTVAEFEAALGDMVPGGIHPEPVRTRYGLHIVRLDRRIDGRDLPFEIARPVIARYLTDHVRRTAQRQYVSQLAGRADIIGIALEAAATPLVQ